MSDIDDDTSATDIKRVRLLRRMLRENGFRRNKYGFWVPDAVGIKPNTTTTDEEEDDEQ